MGHVALGVERAVPGAGQVDRTVESQESFYNAIFIGCGPELAARGPRHAAIGLLRLSVEMVVISAQITTI